MTAGRLVPRDDAYGKAAKSVIGVSRQRRLFIPPTTILSLTMFRSAITKTVLRTATRPSGAAVRPIIARAYHEKVISHYESPRNVSFKLSGVSLLCALI